VLVADRRHLLDHVRQLQVPEVLDLRVGQHPGGRFRESLSSGFFFKS
jgi:hypothetical protein